MSADYEKLGAFYLGREFDPAANALKSDLILYDSKDLTTHAVCVGMTGSGKTGLCLSLLEEAAIDGVPAICIDPKGDLGNLMLTFPDLAPADFKPWVDAGDATRKGVSVDELAAKTAETWRNGLAEWDQTPERISKLRAAADVAIYTPGAETGLPLSVLRSFSPTGGSEGGQAPSGTVPDLSNGALRDRVGSVVSGLLSLIGIEADPIGSREHILLANILEGAWRAGLSLDMTGLIQAVQKPAFDKLGAFDLETFFPAKDRLKLAMQINALSLRPASPAGCRESRSTRSACSSHTKANRASRSSPSRISTMPSACSSSRWCSTKSSRGCAASRAPDRCAPSSTWTRSSGSFRPPRTRRPNSPCSRCSSRRAHSAWECVLATQNPVDLDYKGLANCGTWFIGRLQTERDKMRVIEGLLSSTAASADGDRGSLEALMSNLTQRVFLMRNVHDDAPVLMKTRWALSYLRGPLTGPEIARVMATKKADAVEVRNAVTELRSLSGKLETIKTGHGGPGVPAPSASRPAVGAGIREYFLRASGAPDALTTYKPMILGFAKLHFIDPKLATG